MSGGTANGRVRRTGRDGCARVGGEAGERALERRDEAVGRAQVGEQRGAGVAQRRPAERQRANVRCLAQRRGQRFDVGLVLLRMGWWSDRHKKGDVGGEGRALAMKMVGNSSIRATLVAMAGRLRWHSG